MSIHTLSQTKIRLVTAGILLAAAPLLAMALPTPVSAMGDIPVAKKLDKATPILANSAAAGPDNPNEGGGLWNSATAQSTDATGDGVFKDSGTMDRFDDTDIVHTREGSFTGGIRVATGDVTGDGIPDIVTSPGTGGGPHVKVIDGQAAPARAKLSQNGTTVETANEVSGPGNGSAAIGGGGADVLRGGAGNDTLIGGRGNDAASSAPARKPQDEATAGLLLPAVQKVREVAPRVEGLSQNGTTVETADEVQAPQNEAETSLLLPAVQKVREAAARSKGLSQNGTTVETADEVQAPRRDRRSRLRQNGTTVSTAGDLQAPRRSLRSRMGQRPDRSSRVGRMQPRRTTASAPTARQTRPRR